MRGDDIKAVIEVNPLAEFALVPAWDATAFVRVRGLSQHGTGQWLVAEQTNHAGKWVKTPDADSLIVSSRSLCSVEDAQRHVDKRIALNREHFESKQRVERVVQRLGEHGVTAYRYSDRVYLTDLDALERLLDQLAAAR